MSSSPSTIVVLNMYFASPGRADDVLATRCQASRVRRELGLPLGRVLRATDASNDLPDVLWECEFPSLAAHDDDMAGRGASAEFEAVRERMRGLIDRFERSVWAVRSEEKSLSAELGHGPITVLNAYYPAPGKHARVLAQRLRASRVRSALGHPAGRVLERISPSAARDAIDLPYALWEMNYANLAARSDDFVAVSGNPDFDTVVREMRPLLSRFERGVWRAVPVD